MRRLPPPGEVGLLEADFWLLVAQAWQQAGYDQETAVHVADAALRPVAITARRAA